MPYAKRSKQQYGRKTRGSKRGTKMPRATQLRIRAEVERNELRKHGYRMRSKQATRHMALGKAVHEDGGLRVFRRLNLLMVWNKNDDPDLAKIAEKDRDWVKDHYYGTKHWPD